MRELSKIEIREIDKKFGETAFRLTQERSDFLLPQVLDFVNGNKWVNLRPEYQRRLVWDDSKRSRFIESFLLNIPIPPVFLYEWDLSRYEVMDGQQRLNALVDFYSNKFELTGLFRWKELNGLTYSGLPETLKRGLDRRRISATVLLFEGPTNIPPQKSEVRRLVFERLNTGGQQLRPQELRNCFYEGKFNNLLIELSRHPLFTKIWKIPPYRRNVDADGNISSLLKKDQLFRRMQDCELVLRFFAFRERSNIKGSVRSMLDRCMRDATHLSDDSISDLREAFTSRLHLAEDLFGDAVFSFKDAEGRPKMSQTLYDGVMVALDRLWEQRQELLNDKDGVVRRVDDLLRRESAFAVIVGRPNTSAAVLKRMKLLTKTIKG